jgi:integrase
MAKRLTDPLGLRWPSKSTAEAATDPRREGDADVTQRGTIRKRGSSWTAYWWVEEPRGTVQRSKGGFATKRDAQNYLTKTLAALQTGAFTEPTKVTVGEYLLIRWLPGRAPSLRASTFDSYRRSIDLHVIPALGHVRLQQLTAEHLDRFYADRLQAGLASKTVRNLHTMLRKALKDAVRKNLVVRNVADAADPPPARSPGQAEMKTWTGEQVRSFLHEMQAHRWGAAFFLAATTGMRRGEVLGLRWADVELGAQRLTVNQTILNVAYEITLGSPKTARSRRTIALDPETTRVLVAHKRRQTGERRALGDGYNDRGLVFALENGDPVHPDLFSQTFRRSVRRLGLPIIRLHDLRHTHATMGLEAGIPVKIISTRLGHATTAFTQDIYMHSVPALEEGAAEQIADLIFNAPVEELASDEGDEPPEFSGESQ